MSNNMKGVNALNVNNIVGFLPDIKSTGNK